jgi:hypothetical protein
MTGLFGENIIKTRSTMRKFFKTLGIIVLLLIVTPLIAAFFIRKEYTVERSILINQPKDSVFDYLVMLKNQDLYSVWSTGDPSMNHTYIGTDGTVGFVSAWESTDKNMGKGEQEITAIVPGERMETELRFIKPFKTVSQVYLSTEAANDQSTTVRWGFSGKMNYPFNVLLLVMKMEESIGNDFDKGLGNLKAILEK